MVKYRKRQLVLWAYRWIVDPVAAATFWLSLAIGGLSLLSIIPYLIADHLGMGLTIGYLVIIMAAVGCLLAFIFDQRVKEILIGK